jgi:hypothetical protein
MNKVVLACSATGVGVLGLIAVYCYFPVITCVLVIVGCAVGVTGLIMTDK